MDGKKFIEIKKPVETVHELKDEYKVPSFEEFMKDYQADEKVNYDDLEHRNIGGSESYGPCSKCSNSKSFKLTIALKNCMGSGKAMTVYNVDDAREEAVKILSERGHWDDDFLCFYSAEDRQKLINRINSEIQRHISCNEDVIKVVCNKD